MKSKYLQPDKIYECLGVKNKKEANKVLSSVLSILLYLKPGERIQTSSITIEKLDKDLFHIKSTLKLDQVADDIEKLRIVKFPV